MFMSDGRTQMPLRRHSNFARSAVFLEGEPPRLPPAQVGTGGAINLGTQDQRHFADSLRSADGMSTLWSGTQTTPTFAYSSSTYSCPTSTSVTTISATDYQFCDVIFRNIESPSRLAEWRALPAYAGDVWFASTAPSGSAKETAMSLIKDLTGCAKGVGHTEFGGASPSRALAAFHLPALTRSRLVDRSPCTPRPLGRQPGQRRLGAHVHRHFRRLQPHRNPCPLRVSAHRRRHHARGAAALSRAARRVSCVFLARRHD